MFAARNGIGEQCKRKRQHSRPRSTYKEIGHKQHELVMYPESRYKS